MAAPSEASIQTQIGQAFLALDEIDRKITRDVADPTSQRIDEMIQGLDGDYSSASAAGVEAFRSFAGSVTASSVAQGMIDGHILDYGKNLQFPDLPVTDILERLRRDFQENAKSVQTRGFTFGPPVEDVGNAGDWVVIRLTEDEFDYPLEAATPEVKNFRCVQDAASGATKNQEQFEIGGDYPPKDNVAGFRSTDRLATISAISADNSDTYIQNPSFGQQLDATGGLTDALSGWTIANAVANLTSRADTFYRDSQGEGTTPASLEFTASDIISQVIEDNGGAFDPRLPYYFHVAFRLGTAAAASGILKLTIGTSTVSFDLSTIIDTNWRVLTIVPGKESWFRDFNQSDLTYSIEAENLVANTVIVDDNTIEQFAAFDGTFWAVVGGAIQALVDETAIVTDTAAAPENAIIQYWLWRTYGAYLPASGVPTWTEPAP